MHGRRRRSVARLFAPLALLVAVVAVLLVVQATNEGDKSKGDTAKETSTQQDTTGTTPERPRRVRPTYTVKLNDTLGLISEKTGVAVEQLQTLNPELDPQNLIVGQKIKLRE
ncbi:MAG: LysM domain [Thermoleophilaceae bacterium]|nr:LysM domain [Thermoleophilaceae bacterium]